MVRVRHSNEYDDGVNIVTEYILVFIISAAVFSILIMSSQSIFIDGPSKTVTKNQFMDVGNDIDTKLIDTYLVAPPKDGMISTTFNIPYDIAGHGYNVEIEQAPSPNQNDKEIKITSDQYLDQDLQVMLTLNGVNSTIPITGSTSSHNAFHWVNFTRT